MPGSGFDITVEHHGDAVVLCVHGELDITTSDALRESIVFALRAKPKVLVVDLSAVSFLASGGLFALVTATRMGAGDTTVRVVANRRECERPIHMTGLDAVLALHRSLDEALR